MFKFCAVAVILAATVLPLAWTQSVASKLPAKAQPTTRKKLSPEQELWCPILESGRTQATSLEPAMRSLLLRGIAGGTKQCDPKQVTSILVSAFQATLEIPATEEDLDAKAKDAANSPPTPDSSLRKLVMDVSAKRDLQINALRDLLAIDESQVEPLLPEAESSVRNEILSSLLYKAVHAKNFDRAITILNEIPGPGFPYYAATKLMFDLPTTRDADKQAIFLRALAADKDSHAFIVGGDDFTTMIVRFWKHLPAPVVLEAIHQTLEEAKSHSDHVNLSSSAGSVNFTNEYEYRLFELLPVLEQLDKSKAEDLLKDSQEAKAQLKQFPNGMQSLDSTIRDTLRAKGEQPQLNSGAVGMNDLTPVLARDKEVQNYAVRAEDLATMAAANPTQAIAAAASLPDVADRLAPRAQALLAIARATAKTNSGAAKTALSEMAESLNKTDPSAQKQYWEQSALWIEGSEIAHRIGEDDPATKLIHQGLSQAAKLKLKDEDPDDPNLALKAWWPSVSATSRLLATLGEMSPQAALAEARDIQDADVRVLCEVKMANKALGARGFPSNQTVAKTSASWSHMGVDQ